MSKLLSACIHIQQSKDDNRDICHFKIPALVIRDDRLVRDTVTPKLYVTHYSHSAETLNSQGASTKSSLLFWKIWNNWMCSFCKRQSADYINCIWRWVPPVGGVWYMWLCPFLDKFSCFYLVYSQSQDSDIYQGNIWQEDVATCCTSINYMCHMCWHVQHDCICTSCASAHPSYTPYPIMLFHYVHFFHLFLSRQSMTAFFPRQAASSLLSFYFVNESKARKKCFLCMNLIRI